MSVPAIPSASAAHFYPIRLAVRGRAALAWATIAAALLSLFAGFGPIHSALTPVLGDTATHPLTAFCLMALAGGILRTKRYGRSSSVRIVLLGTIVAICAMRLMAAALVTFADINVVSVFEPTAGFVGAFGVQTAIMLGLFAAAGFMRQGNSRWGGASLLIGLFCFFDTVMRGVFGSGSSVGVFALLGMGTGAAAMISMHLHRPSVRVAFLIGDVGSQTRIMAAAVLAVPLGGALVLDWTKSGGLTAIEVTVLSVVSCSLLFVLLATSARHEGSVAVRRRAERDIAMRSRTDELTGALNRFGMTEVVEGAWLEFKSTGAQFGLVLLDLDYFRRLDATFGQDDGEAVLGRVAKTVQAQLRGFDALGRWDKDEFMVLLKIKDYANIDVVANRIRLALASADSAFCEGLAMEPARMDIAIGMAAFMDADETAASAIIRADVALNGSKTTQEKWTVDLQDESLFDILIEPDTEVTIEERTAAAA